jgi:hypothetical protein
MLASELDLNLTPEELAERQVGGPPYLPCTRPQRSELGCSYARQSGTRLWARGREGTELDAGEGACPAVSSRATAEPTSLRRCQHATAGRYKTALAPAMRPRASSAGVAAGGARRRERLGGRARGGPGRRRGEHLGPAARGRDGRQAGQPHGAHAGAPGEAPGRGCTPQRPARQLRSSYAALGRSWCWCCCCCAGCGASDGWLGPQAGCFGRA